MATQHTETLVKDLNNILQENSVTPAMERVSSYSAQDEDESAELQYAISMSLEQPEARVGGAFTMSDISLNAEDQEELEKALILSILSSEEFDEAVAELHHIKPMSVMETREEEMKVCFSLQHSPMYITHWI
ncbi:hypothetical protein BT96DRAFT_938130 [Gymnopus androsaceus JB14]|uniref:Uncharacterized protein n=1 Tax=Gymnopus androsaceus JB14 TaxID=1447944 RepID=A0A6A4HW64_9AGAR|nr:hypothetical protein BT96DRAFT_938130 [Gymnopus androsaceus JB14]